MKSYVPKPTRIGIVSCKHRNCDFSVTGPIVTETTPNGELMLGDMAYAIKEHHRHTGLLIFGSLHENFSVKFEDGGIGAIESTSDACLLKKDIPGPGEGNRFKER